MGIENENPGAIETLPITAAVPLTVDVGGVPCRPATLGMTEIGELRIWAKKQQADPLAAVRPHLDGMPPEAQRALIDAALAELRRPVMFGSPEFMGAIQSGEGLREVLWLALRRGGADVTREASDAAADALSVVRAGDVIATAFGS